MNNFDHKSIDKKWQEIWEKEGVFHAKDDSEKEKFYCLVEFPYPSGAGLHIGHPRSYTAMDVIARKKRMQGFNVLYPMGWDAFGLPTENYAIKTGRKPQEVTKENIDRFREQLQSIGLSFDWSREVNTTDPAYYKWTQWMFLQFFKEGMAYKKNLPINWCLSCKIGLANEEVVNGVCERCGGEVEKRDKEQWMIAITKYADRLIDDLKTVDYLPKIEKQQVDWIGKSEGAKINFTIDGSDEILTVFTTRPDTIFGATYMVVAPEHAILESIVTDECRDTVAEYQKSASEKTDIDRGNGDKEKTGVFTGAYAINPVNEEKIPIWTADYVMMGYGTGAIMAVPAHDLRDWDFAKKFDLPVLNVINPFPGEVVGAVDTHDLPQAIDSIDAVRNGEVFWNGEGTMRNSEFLNDLMIEQAKEKMINWLEEQNAGERTVNYKLRDWVFSRQRYWGEPIPLVQCENGCAKDKDGWVAIPEDQLPVELPEVEKYEPTDTGESPLAAITDWVNTICPECGGEAKRETDTMPNWAGSSWYFLRYIDPHNDQEFASKDKLKYWMPVDWYNGGMEHTTLHLLYSRFWNKFFADLGYVPESEPYAKRTSHGLILADDGTKMSKSKGNVVNPDDIVAEYGADTLRVYELFIGPFAEPSPWSENGVSGVRRFLDRVNRLEGFIAETEDECVTRLLHQTIKKVSEDIDALRFNTAIAQMMSFVNEVFVKKTITKDSLKAFITLLNPFAPHLTNEMAERIFSVEKILEQTEWISFDEKLAKNDEIEIAIQVNGKLRGSIKVAADISEEEVIELAKNEENVAKYLDGGVKKSIYVKGRLVNFVV